MNKLMKLLCCVLVISCSSQDNFKYKGDPPSEEDMVSYWNWSGASDLIYIEKAYVSVRNRIYLDIDSSMNLYLNGHQISSANFERDFKFIYCNPKKLNHLPESPNKAVVFDSFDFYQETGKYMKNRKLHEGKIRLLARMDIEVSNIHKRMYKIVIELQEAYARKNFSKSVEDLNASQSRELQQKLPFNLEWKN